MITFHIESFEERLEELKVLLPLHYKELALNQEHVPLDPQYNIYIQREKQGELLFIVVRENGIMIGYFISFIAPGLHYKTCLTCTMDIFYICKEKRIGNTGVKLFRFIEKTLKSRGVKRWFMGSKIHADASVLFKRIGASPVETYYSKWLGD